MTTKDESTNPEAQPEVIFKLWHQAFGGHDYYLFRMVGDRVDLRRHDDKAIQLSLICTHAAALRFALLNATRTDEVQNAVAMYLPGWAVEPFFPGVSEVANV